MLEVLQARDLVSGAELARRGVNGRSVRRYIAMLQEIGLPIETVRGPAGAIACAPATSSTPLMFTDEEAVALTLGLAGLARFGLALDPATVLGAQAKLERVLPAALRGRVQALEASIAVAPAPAALTEGTLVALLGQAAERGPCVRLRYRPEQAKASERTVDPYGVAHWSRALVSGWPLPPARRDAALSPRPGRGGRPSDGNLRPARALRRLRLRLPRDGRLPRPLGSNHPARYAARRGPAPPGRLRHARRDRRRRPLLGPLQRSRRPGPWFITLQRPFIVREPPALREALRKLADEVAALAAAGIAT